jgi:hypothetical protein
MSSTITANTAAYDPNSTQTRLGGSNESQTQAYKPHESANPHQNEKHERREFSLMRASGIELFPDLKAQNGNSTSWAWA